ncbi:hypothetical protein J6590_089792 [Homalodisca vitripennis]|nr:hypothetical protein J6590_089792 [Homalodisca vitripennis]
MRTTNTGTFTLATTDCQVLSHHNSHIRHLNKSPLCVPLNAPEWWQYQTPYRYTGSLPDSIPVYGEHVIVMRTTLIRHLYPSYYGLPSPVTPQLTYPALE